MCIRDRLISEKWKYNYENKCWLYEERMEYCYEDYLLFILNKKWIYNYENERWLYCNFVMWKNMFQRSYVKDQENCIYK